MMFLPRTIIRLGSPIPVVTIKSDCYLSAEIDGSVSIDGNLDAVAAFHASKTIGAEYRGASGTWQVFQNSDWGWTKPTIDFTFESGEVRNLLAPGLNFLKILNKYTHTRITCSYRWTLISH